MNCRCANARLVRLSVTGDVAEQDRIRLMDEYSDWCWRPRSCGGRFDFGDEVDFRRGVYLFLEATRKR